MAGIVKNAAKDNAPKPAQTKGKKTEYLFFSKMTVKQNSPKIGAKISTIRLCERSNIDQETQRVIQYLKLSEAIKDLSDFAPILLSIGDL
jgi:hypothetical protein